MPPRSLEFFLGFVTTARYLKIAAHMSKDTTDSHSSSFTLKFVYLVHNTVYSRCAFGIVKAQLKSTN